MLSQSITYKLTYDPTPKNGNRQIESISCEGSPAEMQNEIGRLTALNDS